MILVPDQCPRRSGEDWPYDRDGGAMRIICRYPREVDDMLLHMAANHHRYAPNGKTMFRHSPLAKKIWIAAALVTEGVIEESETQNGSSAVSLTKKGIKWLEKTPGYLEKYQPGRARG